MRVAADRPAVAPAGLEPHERAVLLGYRWWKLAELRVSVDAVYPPRLAAHLGAALTGPAPAEPIDISADG